MKKFLRFTAVLLAALTCFHILPFTVPFLSTAEADSAYSCREIDTVISSIWSACKNRYWNGGKSKAQMTKAADRKDYAYGTGKSSGGTSNYFDGNTCWAFANWVGYCVFKKNPQSAAYDGASAKNDGKTFNGWTVHNKSAKTYAIKPGDILRIYNKSDLKAKNKTATHSVVVWKIEYDKDHYENSKVTFIEGNYPESLQIHVRSSMTISEIRKRIVGVEKAFILESPSSRTHDLNGNGDCRYCGQHFHQYDKATGICAKPGCAEYDYMKGKGVDADGLLSDYYSPNNLRKLIVPASGTLTPRSGTYFEVKEAPRSNADTKITSRKKTVQVEKASVLYRLEKNHVGETWYYVRIEKYSNSLKKDEIFGNIGWIKAGLAAEKWTSAVTVSGVKAPKSNMKAKSNSSELKQVEGIITASGSYLKEVTAAVYDKSKLTEENLALLKNPKTSAADAYKLAAKKAAYKGHRNQIKAETFNVHKFYSNLGFSKLAGGKQYVYVITATDYDGVSSSYYYEFSLKK